MLANNPVATSKPMVTSFTDFLAFSLEHLSDISKPYEDSNLIENSSNQDNTYLFNPGPLIPYGVEDQGNNGNLIDDSSDIDIETVIEVNEACNDIDVAIIDYFKESIETPIQVETPVEPITPVEPVTPVKPVIPAIVRKSGKRLDPDNRRYLTKYEAPETEKTKEGSNANNLNFLKEDNEESLLNKIKSNDFEGPQTSLNDEMLSAIENKQSDSIKERNERDKGAGESFPKVFAPTKSEQLEKTKVGHSNTKKERNRIEKKSPRKILKNKKRKPITENTTSNDTSSREIIRETSPHITAKTTCVMPNRSVKKNTKHLSKRINISKDTKKLVNSPLTKKEIKNTEMERAKRAYEINKRMINVTHDHNYFFAEPSQNKNVQQMPKTTPKKSNNNCLTTKSTPLIPANSDNILPLPTSSKNFVIRNSSSLKINSVNTFPYRRQSSLNSQKNVPTQKYVSVLRSPNSQDQQQIINKKIKLRNDNNKNDTTQNLSFNSSQVNKDPFAFKNSLPTKAAIAIQSSKAVTQSNINGSTMKRPSSGLQYGINFSTNTTVESQNKNISQITSFSPHQISECVPSSNGSRTIPPSISSFQVNEIDLKINASEPQINLQLNLVTSGQSDASKALSVGEDIKPKKKISLSQYIKRTGPVPKNSHNLSQIDTVELTNSTNTLRPENDSQQNTITLYKLDVTTDQNSIESRAQDYEEKIKKMSKIALEANPKSTKRFEMVSHKEKIEISNVPVKFVKTIQNSGRELVSRGTNCSFPDDINTILSQVGNKISSNSLVIEIIEKHKFKTVEEVDEGCRLISHVPKKKAVTRSIYVQTDISFDTSNSSSPKDESAPLRSPSVLRRHYSRERLPRPRSRSSSSDSSSSSTSSYSWSGSVSGSYHWKRKTSMDFNDEEMEKLASERKVVYVGGPYVRRNKRYLREAFERFGEIIKIKIIPKRNPEGHNYGFVTFDKTEAACKAVTEYGNDPYYQVGFGGRSQFCKKKYEDLDGVAAQRREDEIYDGSAKRKPQTDFTEELNRFKKLRDTLT